mmetsp:Transcript_38904/g.69658  ORF Transcript_38904/g.69658 Transcript_38904/m.69658 type:complete len:2180 (-) Transcript_38904:244-6783(-)
MAPTALAIRAALQPQATIPSASRRGITVVTARTGSKTSSFCPRNIQLGSHAGPTRLARVSVRPLAASKPTKANAAAVETASEVEMDRIEAFVKQKGGNRPIRKVLIANNGMAAAKCIISMRRWAYLTFGDENAITFVAMATPEDLAANAEFIRQADDFIEVPGGANRNNYANVPLIVSLAAKVGADAVWPGWGHASEKPELPRSLKERGITFIGPTAPVMSVLGDKIAANILAQTAGVPSIPWSGDGLVADLTEDGTIPKETFDKGCIHTLQQALDTADRIGYPVMLKASEGGGGKGIRMSANKEELISNYDQVRAEVPGSPVFMMQLCAGARHLEVQIVGDMHGNAVALNGRDCTTQRRFQKIFEEGPPTIAPPEIFHEMERAAQRLTQTIGYIGAGTVEYLFNANTKEYYFLELNPRLQVEHPVTEGITGTNVPATQLQVAMGIPLYNIPEIRIMYGKDPQEQTPIDFMTEEYLPITRHVIAARITAENPDEGFKPTSGAVERIQFQSTPNVWGYFSVGPNGAVHEFADSQFGHVFASGNTREDARKALILALKDIVVRGEIRTAVEYLVQLLNTPEFIENTIDTSWLDGLIKEKQLGIDVDPQMVVMSAAVAKAHAHVRNVTDGLLQNFSKGQLGTQGVETLNSFPVEITYRDTKYEFNVTRFAPGMLRFSIGNTVVEAKVREQSDGTLLAWYAGSTHNVTASEDALGLRLTLDGTTHLLPTQFDPSELRTDVTGKLIRFLQPDGAEVKKGKPFAEVEAMKMVMPLVAMETGTINHKKSAGAVIEAGELLANLELANPSDVKIIEPFTGRFTPGGWTEGMPSILSSTEDEDEDIARSVLVESITEVNRALDGYAGGSTSRMSSNLLNALSDMRLVEEGAIQDLMGPAAPTMAARIMSRIRPNSGDASDSTPAQQLWGLANDVVSDVLIGYLDLEEQFVAEATDRVVDNLIKEHKDDLSKVINILVAHNALKPRTELLINLLKLLPTLPQRMMRDVPIGWGDDGASPSPTLLKTLERVSRLRGQAYGELALCASNLIEESRKGSLVQRYEELKKLLTGKVGLKSIFGVPPGDLDSLAMSSTLAVDLLPSVFVEKDEKAREAALEVYTKRVYRAHRLVSIDVSSPSPAESLAQWKFQYRLNPETSPMRYGIMRVTTTEKLEDCVTKMLGELRRSVDQEEGAQGDVSRFPLHVLHVVVHDAEDEEADRKMPMILAKHRDEMKKLGVKLVNLVSLTPLMLPRYYTFLQSLDYAEDAIYRGERPTMPHLMELHKLPSLWKDMQRLATVNRDLHVYAATDVNSGPRGTRHLLLRRIAHSSDTMDGGLERLITKSVDAAELALLDPAASTISSVHLYINFLPVLAGEAPAVIGTIMNQLSRYISHNAPKLLKQSVDEIELRFVIGDAAEAVPIRVIASSVTGQWLKVEGFQEILNPVTGRVERFCRMNEEGEGEECSLEDSVADVSRLAVKRAAARRIGTTFAYDFLGLLEKKLVGQWNTYISSVPSAVMPSVLFEAKELVMNRRGDLVETQRPAGSNDRGMVAWRCKLYTPEYPGGREVILIANDCTFQSGSFGVSEDEFYAAASKVARKEGLPRVYISCNAGARIGLVEELKDKFKIAWNDPSNPSLGFKYLYFTPDEYDSVPEKSVIVKEVFDEGEQRFMITDIIGTKHGIGVENLMGSGLIAGETSAAYEETFTLSYVTGRSVGIGAYICRLGQRVIQMDNGPLILTGYGALNKLLGRTVYTSQDQLGGPQIMVPNGITHQQVPDDQAGVEAILKWLSYIPATNKMLPPVLPTSDPVDRDVGYTPTKEPYDPRWMLTGRTVDGVKESGFFDEDSWTETLAGWGKSVVTGRAKLGGIPMGVIAVETRLMEQRVPADPADPESREAVLPQAGQVWFPDSAFKTATAIRDFGRSENLPVMIFANWRGFSGGTRDMAREVLKFGAMIVDALREYNFPVFIYIPPKGEIRGGAWVVVDRNINPDCIEFYADTDARGGILEPPGICEVKFRAKDQIALMHRLDPVLKELSKDPQDNAVEIAKREDLLLPLYTQVAHEFADMHDRTGRMTAKGAIRCPVPWKDSRRFFFKRATRRLALQGLSNELMEKCPGMKAAGLGSSMSMIQGWATADNVDWENDDAVIAWLKEDQSPKVEASVRDAMAAEVRQLLSGLDPEAAAKVLKAAQE